MRLAVRLVVLELQAVTPLPLSNSFICSFVRGNIREPKPKILFGFLLSSVSIRAHPIDEIPKSSPNIFIILKESHLQVENLFGKI